MQGINEQIKELISKRLDAGQIEYGKDLPIDDGRDYKKEAIEEIADALVYTLAEMIKNDSQFSVDYKYVPIKGETVPRNRMMSFNKIELILCDGNDEHAFIAELLDVFERFSVKGFWYGKLR